MASLYYEATHNDTFLMEILPSLDREYEFWSQNRSVTGGQYANLNTYSAPLTDPRPEAYREDITTSKFVGMLFVVDFDIVVYIPVYM